MLMVWAGNEGYSGLARNGSDSSGLRRDDSLTNVVKLTSIEDGVTHIEVGGPARILEGSRDSCTIPHNTQ